MEKVEKGDILKIQCYKHNGQIYRNWDETVVLEVNDSFIVCANNAVRVTEIDGRKWTTKEPAILFFYKNKWFNIISQFKKNGIYYYCNIATPYIIEDKTIKYIDYDLDLRVFPDKTFRVLDRGEYEYHKNKMNYSEEIDKVVNVSSSETISRNIWTSVTTVVSIVTLLVANLSSIFTFNVSVFIGLIAGSISSSLIIGSKVWSFFELRSQERPDDDEEEELLVKGINS